MLTLLLGLCFAEPVLLWRQKPQLSLPPREDRLYERLQGSRNEQLDGKPVTSGRLASLMLAHKPAVSLTGVHGNRMGARTRPSIASVLTPPRIKTEDILFSLGSDAPLGGQVDDYDVIGDHDLKLFPGKVVQDCNQELIPVDPGVSHEVFIHCDVCRDNDEDQDVTSDFDFQDLFDVRSWAMQRTQTDAENLLRAVSPSQNLMLSLTLCNSDTIEEVSKDMHSGEGACNSVLTLPTYSESLLGDMAVNLDDVEEVAAEYGHSARDEMRVRLIMGLLILLGYEDVEEKLDMVKLWSEKLGWQGMEKLFAEREVDCSSEITQVPLAEGDQGEYEESEDALKVDLDEETRELVDKLGW